MAVAPDEKTVIAKYYDHREETVVLLEPVEAVLVEAYRSLQPAGEIL